MLASAALAIAFVCLLILPSGPHESDETQSWVLAILVAIPAGFWIAWWQERRLTGAAPAAATRGVAGGTVLVALSFMLRRVGPADRLDHGIILLAAVAALLSPVLASRLWRRPEDVDTTPALAIASVWFVALGLLIAPSHALRLSNLLPALVLAGVLAALLVGPSRRAIPGRWRNVLDAVLCVVLVLAVVQLPILSVEYIGTLVYHQGFFLGPINDVLGGRAMLAGAWSQYGVGLIDALAGVFTVVPIGFGTMMLIVAAATAVEYVCVYVTMRLAGVGQLLVVLTIVAAGAGNLFSPLAAYLLYPSAGPIRFGMPYLIVLAAVAGARHERHRRAAQGVSLAILALGAVWSFETFVYCAATYGCIVLVEAVSGQTGVVRRVLRAAAWGIGVSAAAVALFSLVTFLLAGSLDWGPYFEYLQLYTTGDLGALPVILFSAGPIMAATIFFTAVSVLWLAWRYPDALEPPIRNALAGFTGIAIGTFTYYLGRSHPNNLLVIMVPTMVVTGLWVHVLLRARTTTWRTLVISALMFGWAVIIVAAWPSVKEKWDTTALSLAVPGQGGSLRIQIDEYADNPSFDPLAPIGVEMLARHLPPHAPALVLTRQELTMEILVRSERPNLLPISDPAEDTIIESSYPRVQKAAEEVPAGTLMLTSRPRPNPEAVNGLGLPVAFNDLQNLALAILHERFEFEPVEAAKPLELVRLVPRGGP